MRILLAYDGSSDATQAADLVKSMAWPPESVVRVVSVMPPAIAMTVWAGDTGVYQAELDAQISAYFNDAVNAVVERLQAPDRTVSGEVLRGRPATVIVDEARLFAADLVVIGSRGRGSIASLVLGSVSGEVVDQAACPVLVARRAEVSRVVLAADGSTSAAAAESLLAEWPVFDGLPVRVVSVADVPLPWTTGIAPTMYGRVLEAYAHDVEQVQKEHQTLADESLERLQKSGRDATAEVRTGDPAAEILAVADDWRADLVVLGSRGRTGLTRLLLGSVARNVVHGSSASILVVREVGETGSTDAV